MSRLYNVKVGPLVAASAAVIAASQSPGTGAITLANTAGVALDVARRVIITSGGTDSGISFTVNGTNRDGNPISEIVLGVNTAAAATTQDFARVNSATHTGTVATTITIGTNNTASGPWYLTNHHVAPLYVKGSATVSGAVSYLIESTPDNLDIPPGTDTTLQNPRNPQMTFPGVFTELTAQTAATAVQMQDVASVRLTIASGTGFAYFRVVQGGLGGGN